MASWLVYLTLDCIRVQVLARDIVLCSWVRHCASKCYLDVHMSTSKFNAARLIRWTKLPIQEGVELFLSASYYMETKDKHQLSFMIPLACMQTSPFLFYVYHQRAQLSWLMFQQRNGLQMPLVWFTGLKVQTQITHFINTITDKYIHESLTCVSWSISK